MSDLLKREFWGRVLEDYSLRHGPGAFTGWSDASEWLANLEGKRVRITVEVLDDAATVEPSRL